MERAARVFGKLKLPKDCVSAEEIARAAWPVAVGAKIASRCGRLTLVRTRLVVEVDDAIWQRQLFALREQILRRFREVLGNRTVDDLEFKVAPPRRAPQREEINRPADEADGIRDPVLRRIYKSSRQKAFA